MSKLIAAIYQNPNIRTRVWTDVFSTGLERHGVTLRNEECLEFGSYEFRPQEIKGADIHVFWSMRAPELLEFCRRQGQPFICIDHGYTEDRHIFKSINLNGLNGLSELDVQDFASQNSRCLKHGWEIKPRSGEGKQIIVTGQIYDDKSLEGTDIYAWAKFKIAELEIAGYRSDILFKRHPKEKPEAIDRYKELGVPLYEGSMEDALKVAEIFYTYSSTTGARAWLNGVAAYAASPVSMIYEDQFKPYTEANRQNWLNGISFRQFNQEEITSGLVWDLFKHQIIGHAPGQNYPMTLVERPEEEFSARKIMGRGPAV